MKYYQTTLVLKIQCHCCPTFHLTGLTFRTYRPVWIFSSSFCTFLYLALLTLVTNASFYKATFRSLGGHVVICNFNANYVNIQLKRVHKLNKF